MFPRGSVGKTGDNPRGVVSGPFDIPMASQLDFPRLLRPSRLNRQRVNAHARATQLPCWRLVAPGSPLALARAVSWLRTSLPDRARYISCSLPCVLREESNTTQPVAADKSTGREACTTDCQAQGSSARPPPGRPGLCVSNDPAIPPTTRKSAAPAEQTRAGFLSVLHRGPLTNPLAPTARFIHGAGFWNRPDHRQVAWQQRQDSV